MIYIAYGSNMSTSQMSYRCPDAKIVGTGYLENWRLMFKSYYATIEKEDGYRTPIVFWDIDDMHEQALDRYEGYPGFYYKTEVPIKVEQYLIDNAPKVDKGMVYIMHEDNPLKLPSMGYVRDMFDDYIKFGFNTQILEEALRYSAKGSKSFNMYSKIKY